MLDVQSTLGQLLLNSTRTYSKRPALEVNSTQLTYDELWWSAAPLISILNNCQETTAAILMNRSLEKFCAVYACALSAKCYMPLPMSAVAESILYMLDTTETKLIIIDEFNLLLLDKILEKSKRQLAIIYYGYSQPALQHANQHQIYHLNDHAHAINYTDYQVHYNDHAYIMFTSGTTGIPKAVKINQPQIGHYLQNMQQQFQPQCRDRFSQVIELTFDLSVHDIFLCWSVGACLCVFIGDNYLSLANYLEQSQLTFWLSVPSTGIGLERFRQLTSARFPSLKKIFFCGEPLPNYLAYEWLRAAPHAKIFNLYGPTEATIAVTSYQWQHHNDDSRHDIVPIGKSLPGIHTKIVNLKGVECKTGITGELWLSGSQIIAAYFNAQGSAQQKFVITEDNKYWYRTGDLVYADSYGFLHFKGRLDDQLQIRGQRIERLELETRFRQILATPHIAVIPSPVTEEGVVLGIAIGYIVDADLTDDEIKQRCRQHFSTPLVPTEYFRLNNFPLNINGKVDYPVLIKCYQKKINGRKNYDRQ